jgi:polyisoprenoid-binding protein YceI
MRLAFALLAVLAVVSPAQTAADAQWLVQQADSRLGFVATWEDAEFEGVFPRFTADIFFEPARATAGRFNVTVDVTSADTNSRDRDEAMGEPEWFHFSAYPEATFVSRTVRAVGGSQFEVEGILSIKGVELDLQLPFIWEQDEDRALMQGETTVTRTDFAIGEGEWASGDVIGLDVRIVVDLVLRRAAPAALSNPATVQAPTAVSKR